MKQETKKTAINLHHLFWYFVIFSVVGLFIETIYCYFTTGVLESRKGLLWGPFCPVYGIGAAILIVVLNRYQYHGFKLFFVGAILGNVIEYLLSYLLEAVYGTRFWDYSYLHFNLNGRICILYSIFWGILSVVLLKLIKPYLDHIIDLLSSKLKTGVEIALFVFFVINALATVWAVTAYENRAKAIYFNEPSTNINNNVSKIENTLFSNEKMLKTFPNLRFIDNAGNEVWIRDILQ